MENNEVKKETSVLKQLSTEAKATLLVILIAGGVFLEHDNISKFINDKIINDKKQLMESSFKSAQPETKNQQESTDPTLEKYGTDNYPYFVIRGTVTHQNSAINDEIFSKFIEIADEKKLTTNYPEHSIWDAKGDDHTKNFFETSLKSYVEDYLKIDSNASINKLKSGESLSIDIIIKTIEPADGMHKPNYSYLYHINDVNITDAIETDFKQKLDDMICAKAKKLASYSSTIKINDSELANIADDIEQAILEKIDASRNNMNEKQYDEQRNKLTDFSDALWQDYVEYSETLEGTVDQLLVDSIGDDSSKFTTTTKYNIPEVTGKKRRGINLGDSLKITVASKDECKFDLTIEPVRTALHATTAAKSTKSVKF